jgi:hypothetical protein
MATQGNVAIGRLPGGLMWMAQASRHLPVPVSLFNCAAMPAGATWAASA